MIALFFFSKINSAPKKKMLGAIGVGAAPRRNPIVEFFATRRADNHPNDSPNDSARGGIPGQRSGVKWKTAWRHGRFLEEAVRSATSAGGLDVVEVAVARPAAARSVCHEPPRQQLDDVETTAHVRTAASPASHGQKKRRRWTLAELGPTARQWQSRSAMLPGRVPVRSLGLVFPFPPSSVPSATWKFHVSQNSRFFVGPRNFLNTEIRILDTGIVDPVPMAA